MTKQRPTPARDRARAAIRKLRTIARRSRWLPTRLRAELRKRRCACPTIWRAVIREAFGTHSLALPDLRQAALFAEGN